MGTPGARGRESSPFRGSNDSTLRPPTGSFSSLSRLFSRRSRLDSSLHKSQRPARFTKVVVDATSEPLHVLSGLMRTLRESNVPGPKLLRLESEYTHLIGKGAQFEVFGLAEHLSASLKQERGNASEILAQNLGSLAVKRSRAAKTKKAVLSRDASAHFTFQLRAAHREIDALCFPPFREHPNIIKLIGWGLCLDSLENPDQDSPRIPLLILERADCTFTEYLQNRRSHHPEKYYSGLQPICVDIGQGLQALHSENIAHGDLKPENILMFKHHGRWTAKLCDFGLSADDLKQDESAVVYHGTPCWRAPEVMTQDRIPLLSGSLQSCDVFAFGLVVWSAYSRTGQAPLRTSDEKRGNAYDLATSSLKVETDIPGSDLERLLCVVQSALHRDPLQRRARPWELFRDPLTEDASPRPRILMYTKRMAKRSWSLLSCVTLLIMRHIARFWAIMTLTICPRIKNYCINPWKPMEPISAIPERQARYLETYSLYADLDPSASPHDISPFRHLPSNCFDLHKLCDSMQWAVTGQDDILLYALARIRSRLKLCCWQKVSHGREINVVDAAIEGKHEFETLAWLCRGEIGRHEVQKRPRNKGSLWLSTYERPASFDYRYISRQSLNAKARVDRFLLLLENGGHIEDEVAPQQGSVFLHFLMTLTEFGKAGYGDHRISLICRRFKHLAQQNHTAPQTRYYMTGELPENIDNINDFSTTALHDSVLARHYSAVEQLVRMGFVVNALNDRKMTALQIALQIHSQHPSIDTVRILALLKQSTAHPVHIAPLDQVSSTVPLGWEVRSFDFGHRDKLEYFHESFTNSHTFQKPNFSLFEDRRLALGYRKILGYGQTYYLDLVRFIDPGKSESKGETASDRNFVFDDKWYQNEPARSEEERLRVEKLRRLPETGTLTWRYRTPKIVIYSEPVQDPLLTRFRHTLWNTVLPLITRNRTSSRHLANERTPLKPRRRIALYEYISDQMRGFRLWPEVNRERSHIEAFFDDIVAKATDDGSRLGPERREHQQARQAYRQERAKRRSHQRHKSDPLAWQRRARFVPDRIDTPYLDVNGRTDGATDPAGLDSDFLRQTRTRLTTRRAVNNLNDELVNNLNDELPRELSNNRIRGPRRRSGNFLTRSINTVLSSIGSSNTAVDRGEREALLAAANGTVPYSTGDAYESGTWDDERYLDINEQYPDAYQAGNPTMGDCNV